ncbi:MAG: hypothetical protein LIP01_15425 [Tannerellaceae bacterium]|nr:hypothetical protein [Tannerellaceae bacterium]
MLESYLLTSSQRFTLMTGGYLNKNNVSGAIVKRSSSYKAFDEVLTQALATSHIELSAPAALNYLAEEGYIIQRRFSGIEILLIKACELRNKINNN